MKRLAATLLVIVAAAPVFAAPPPAPLIYTISPVIEGGTVRALAIELRFRTAAATRETTLQLPNEWGGKDRLYEALEDIQVQGTGASLAPGTKPELRIIKHAPNALLRIRYRVHHADEGPNR